MLAFCLSLHGQMEAWKSHEWHLPFMAKVHVLLIPHSAYAITGGQDCSVFWAAIIEGRRAVLIHKNVVIANNDT
jgi:hypothetical protein